MALQPGAAQPMSGFASIKKIDGDGSILSKKWMRNYCTFKSLFYFTVILFYFYFLLLK